MKITQADTLTIQMDYHPIQTNWCPNLCHPHHFYARCPSWHNPPPSLSCLGTGTRWLGSIYKIKIFQAEIISFSMKDLFHACNWV